jgi:hypothetical protein
MKNLWPKILGVVVCIVLGWTGSNVYHAAKYHEAMEVAERLKVTVNLKEAELAQVRRQYDEEIDTLRGMVTSASTIIADLEEERDILADTAEAQTAEIRELRTAEVEELMARYPALRAYDLAKDRLLETKDKIIFNLTEAGKKKDDIIKWLGVPILVGYDENGEEVYEYPEGSITSALNKKGLTWKEQYESQVTLTVAIETAFKNYRKKGGNEVLWGLGGLTLGIIGGLVAH